MTITEIGVVSLVVATFGTKIFDYISERKKAQELAIVEQKKALAEERKAAQLNEIQKTGKDTHTLSNSAMGVVLADLSVAKHTIYVQSERIAGLTNDVADRAAVQVAQAAWVSAEKFAAKHEAQQLEVDRNSP